MAIYKLGDKVPQTTIDKDGSYFIADGAKVIGDVTIGDRVSIWFNAVIRGDIAPIDIGNETNIQDGCVLHVDIDTPLVIGDRVTVGHNATLHGCAIHDECLIGMNAVVLNGATIGKNCIIGANALVTENKIIPDNSLVLGSPAKVIRKVTPEEVEHIRWLAAHYVEQIASYLITLNEVLD